MAMLQRKIVVASYSAIIYSFLLSIIYQDPFMNIYSVMHMVSTIPIYLLFSLPIILIYGVSTSIVSDKIAAFLSTKGGNSKQEALISLALHILFGLILLWVSLFAAVLFYVIDRILIKNNKVYGWIAVLKSIAIPIVLWLVLVGIANIYDIL